MGIVSVSGVTQSATAFVRTYSFELFVWLRSKRATTRRAGAVFPIEASRMKLSVIVFPCSEIRWDSPKGIITSGFQRYKILSLRRNGPLKRTVAGYTIMLGLTAVMIGLYLGEFKTLAEILRSYTFLLP